MAREWRAAQGKDCGPSEKQVTFSRGQQPPGAQAPSTNAGGANGRMSGADWWVGSMSPEKIGRFSFSPLVSECLFNNQQAP